METDEILSYFDESWHNLVLYFIDDIKLALSQKGKIYPPLENVFKVFQMDIYSIKIVLLGQDPYHGYGQATGLSFSCNKNNNVQQSLQNIFKEIKIEFPERNYKFINGDLTKWFENEKIFLLNSALTVKEGQPGSLLKFWNKFTDGVIRYIEKYNETCIFLLLGNPAKEKKIFIKNKERIVEGVHPSPFSAYKGFFNSNIFINVEKKVGQINWQN